MVLGIAGRTAHLTGIDSVAVVVVLEAGMAGGEWQVDSTEIEIGINKQTDYSDCSFALKCLLKYFDFGNFEIDCLLLKCSSVAS